MFNRRSSAGVPGPVFTIHTRAELVALTPLVCVSKKRYLKKYPICGKLRRSLQTLGGLKSDSSHQHQVLISPAPRLHLTSTKRSGTVKPTDVKGIRWLTSPAPSALWNTGNSLSKATGLDFFADHVGEGALRFKAGELGHDARLGSRGDGHLTSDNVAVDQGVESE